MLMSSNISKKNPYPGNKETSMIDINGSPNTLLPILRVKLISDSKKVEVNAVLDKEGIPVEPSGGLYPHQGQKFNRRQTAKFNQNGKVIYDAVKTRIEINNLMKELQKCKPDSPTYESTRAKAKRALRATGK
ncbi:hypothetical protein CEXT_385051 [Caerostris extrusa]|uniref:LAGLIDADG homing endonuclease n=1 Tax=Caerostris extrusa TaxID=172846 RepID=A0AAV4QKZ0_CAEEX|nr:hypothetical protein CEXT_385051 [Caerostris extrusa]